MYKDIVSPKKYYFEEGEITHKNNVDEYFNLLKKEAKIEEVANAETVRQYDETTSRMDGYALVIKKQRSARGWGIFGICALAIVLIVVWFSIGLVDGLAAFLTVATVAGSIVWIVSLCKSASRAIKDAEASIAELRPQADKFFAEASEQVAPLLALMTDEDGLRLVQKTFPSVVFDDFVSGARIDDLKGYGYEESLSDNECVVDAIAGELYGNPILKETRRTYFDSTKTYYGSLHISWTESYTDSNGNRQTRTRSETLHASVTKFAPAYYLTTKLHYGHDEVPNLTFSRQGKNVNQKSDSSIERQLRKGEKKLEKMHQKALREGEDFTSVVNTDFEVLFGATDRSDELDFRYLFTPRAQESMLELILCDESYGDDFDFYKTGKLNTIVSDHAQYESLYPRVTEYFSHDFKEVEWKYKKRNYEFFKSLFFDFAPVISIPAYRQPLVRSEKMEIGGLSMHARYTAIEAMERDLAPDGSETSVIYRAVVEGQEDGADILSVGAYAFYTEPRCDYVSVRGGDGYWHEVPVDWREYIPIEKHSKIKVWRKSDKEEEEGVYSVRAIAAKLL